MTQRHEGLKAAIYARCASATVDNPIQAQVERCRAAALERGLQLVARYEDPNHSGLKFTGRPGLAAMLHEAKLGTFQCLVVADLPGSHEVKPV